MTVCYTDTQNIKNICGKGKVHSHTYYYKYYLSVIVVLVVVYFLLIFHSSNSFVFRYLWSENYIKIKIFFSTVMNPIGTIATYYYANLCQSFDFFLLWFRRTMKNLIFLNKCQCFRGRNIFQNYQWRWCYTYWGGWSEPNWIWGP